MSQERHADGQQTQQGSLRRVPGLICCLERGIQESPHVGREHRWRELSFYPPGRARSWSQEPQHVLSGEPHPRVLNERLTDEDRPLRDVGGDDLEALCLSTERHGPTTEEA